MSIGKKIKHLRELRNFTQGHIAQKLGLSLGGYNKIESDKIDITLKRLNQIADVLETDLPTILNFEAKHVFTLNSFKDSAIGVILQQQNFYEKGLNQNFEIMKSEIATIRENLDSLKKK